MNIAITGYCGTGSSAVMDLLMEYKTCSSGKLTSYEHIPLYTPDGLFDLEDKLLIGNNLQRSDEALYSFYKEMRRLNDNNFGWFGGYKRHFGNKFMTNVDRFLSHLVEYSFEGGWSYTAEQMKFSCLQFGKDCIRTLLGKKTYRDFGYKQVNSPKEMIRYSFVSPEQFYAWAREFVRDYMNMTQSKKKNTVYDHLVLPHNLWRIDKYFDKDFRIIVVDRDVRDLFVLGKYVWPAMGSYAPFPRDARQFIHFWKHMRECERPVTDSRIMKINFEDLIYKYDHTVSKIESFLELKAEDHTKKKTQFIPEKSKNNTQNFMIKEKWQDEIKIIQDELPEYIYDFPYEIRPSLNETFDR